MKTLTKISLLAVAGLLISLYLTFLYFSTELLSGNLAEIHSSAYAKFFGIPVAVIGVIGYALILGTALISESKESASQGLFILSLAGVIMSIRQMYGAIFVLDNICPWCVMSAVVITIIFIISVRIPRKAKTFIPFPRPIQILLMVMVMAIVMMINSLIITATENTQILTEGKYAGYSASSTTGCFCNSYFELVIVNADKTESYAFYDSDDDGTLGSSDSDKYTHYIGKGHEQYFNNKGTIVNLYDTTLKDPNEVMSAANADFQELLILIGKN